MRDSCLPFGIWGLGSGVWGQGFECKGLECGGDGVGVECLGVGAETIVLLSLSSIHYFLYRSLSLKSLAP